MAKFTAPVAVVVLIARIENGVRHILLQRRQNTGFGDGMWDFACSGHVEEGESMTEACVRECREELGIIAEAQRFKFFTLIYKRDGDITYVNSYFYLTEYYAKPVIMEQNKCSELKWFSEDDLPDDLLDDRRQAYEAFLKGIPFIEYGWKE